MHNRLCILILLLKFIFNKNFYIKIHETNRYITNCIENNSILMKMDNFEKRFLFAKKTKKKGTIFMSAENSLLVLELHANYNHLILNKKNEGPKQKFYLKPAGKKKVFRIMQDNRCLTTRHDNSLFLNKCLANDNEQLFEFVYVNSSNRMKGTNISPEGQKIDNVAIEKKDETVMTMSEPLSQIPNPYQNIMSPVKNESCNDELMNKVNKLTAIGEHISREIDNDDKKCIDDILCAMKKENSKIRNMPELAQEDFISHCNDESINESKM